MAKLVERRVKPSSYGIQFNSCKKVWDFFHC